MASDKNNLLFEKTSFLQGGNSAFIKELYLKYLNNPKSIPKSWLEFFKGLNDDEDIIKKEILGPSWAPKKKGNLEINIKQEETQDNGVILSELRVVTKNLSLFLQHTINPVPNPAKYDNKFIAGSLAGIIAQTLMYFGDTIKRQMQINGLNGELKKYNNLRECIKHIYKNYGIRGFYPALGINTIKAVPGASIQFMVYDYCKEYFSNIRVLY